MHRTARKRLHLGLLMEATGKHVASWLDPATQADAADDIDYFVAMARTAERGKFDLVFASDSPGVPTENVRLLARRALFMTRFEPATLLAALAMKTERIGLGGTMSTSFTEPYNVARYFASLDHLSRGRAAWNVVTTASDYSARNFGLDRLPDHAERYERAREFVEVVKALWDTYEDDAFIRDRAKAQYFDPRKFHPISHRGRHFSVRGALNSSRTPQGRPVIIQAGASEDGRSLAAATADVIFSSATSLSVAKAFYADLKRRAGALGRAPDEIKILPGLTVVLGSSRGDAEEKYRAMQERIHPDVVRDTLATRLEMDLTGFPLDEAIPPEWLPAVGNRHKAFFGQLTALVRSERLTLRQLFLRSEAQGFRGTPSELADHMQVWIDGGAADGFMVSFESMASDLDTFVDEVIPELQCRGRFRTEYAGTTLREHFGLSRPKNRHSA